MSSPTELSITPVPSEESAARPVLAITPSTPVEPAAPVEKRPEDRRGWNPCRWRVRQKIWQGFRGWRAVRGKCVKLGTRTWDYKTTFFATKKEAQAFIHTQGCDCCARPPAKVRESRYYRSGYGDYIMLLRG